MQGYFKIKWNVDHYRGIAILPRIGKLFESMVCKELSLHFKHYISTRQHSFVNGRSTLTDLLECRNQAVTVSAEPKLVDETNK